MHFRAGSISDFIEIRGYYMIAAAVYIACFVLMSRFTDDWLVMAVDAYLLWMALILPITFVVGLFYAGAKELFYLLEDFRCWLKYQYPGRKYRGPRRDRRSERSANF